eukprot:UN03053
MWNITTKNMILYKYAIIKIFIRDIYYTKSTGEKLAVWWERRKKKKKENELISFLTESEGSL